LKEEGRYILGVDLGQSYDFTVLSIFYARFNTSQRLTYDLIFLKKFVLKQSYLTIIDEIIALIKLYDLEGKYTMAVDYTGVGRPVFDYFMANGLTPMGITITGGATVNRQTSNTVTVPKKDIVTYLQLVLQTRRLRIPKTLDLLDDLRKEFLSFQFKVGSSAQGTFGGSGGVHDDIVMAMGMAIWLGEYHTRKKLRAIGV
jgi:hypothetical protein